VRLRVLERKGFVFRDYEPTIPPSVTYGITKRMKDIGKVMGTLTLWRRSGSKRTATIPPSRRAPKSILYAGSFEKAFLPNVPLP